jgi:hypothetical protein
MRRSPCGYCRTGGLDDVGIDEGEEELAMDIVYWLAGAASSVSSLFGSNSPVEDLDVPAKRLLHSARHGGEEGADGEGADAEDGEVDDCSSDGEVDGGSGGGRTQRRDARCARDSDVVLRKGRKQREERG